MYLLDSQQLMDLLSRKMGRPVFRWIEVTKPRRDDLFVSVLSMRKIPDTIEHMAPESATTGVCLLQEGRHELEETGSLIDTDMPIVYPWQTSLSGDLLADIDGP